MRTAIVTFQYPANYGAVLQCLALQRILSLLGHSVEVLDFRPPASFPKSFWSGWGIRRGEFLHNIPKRWIEYRYGAEMEQKFAEFRSKYMNLSPLCSSRKQVATLAHNYDAFIAGSDQIWHFARESVYFLDWGKPYAGKRISYAPCCGHVVQPLSNSENIKKWITNIDKLSVRNGFSHDLINELTGLSPEIVADPTLLVEMEDVSVSMNLPSSGYILMYTLGEEIDGGHKKVIELIREKVGNLPVIAVVPSAHKPHQAPWADRIIYTAGPGEWVWLIANAAFVYTDSFHGVLFSLKSKRPFLTYYAEEGRAPRIVDLAQRYLLDDCVVSSAEEAAEKLQLDADIAESRRLIKAHVEKSKYYLQCSLEF